MKKLKSIKGIPLSYIQSILKIDPSSPSGLSWLPREDVQFKYDNKNAGCKHADQRKYQTAIAISKQRCWPRRNSKHLAKGKTALAPH